MQYGQKQERCDLQFLLAIACAYAAAGTANNYYLFMVIENKKITCCVFLHLSTYSEGN